MLTSDSTTAIGEMMMAAPGPSETAASAVASMRGLAVSLWRRGARTPVLRGVDLDIGPGEIVGLVGESGSGKSVLALTMLGLLPSASRPVISGDVTVAGVDILHASPAQLREMRRNRVGMIFQDPMTSLNPTMRIGKQICEVTGDSAEAISLLTAVGVPEPARRMRAFPHELSGGLRQRVMAAIALAGRPRFIVADEPTTALDVTVQAQLLALLRDLRDQFGCGILFITHDLAVAAQITDRIAVLYRGRLAEVGPTAELLRQPSHPYTTGLLGSRLTLTTPRHEALTALPSDRSTGATDQPAGCAYHTRCPLRVERCTVEQPPWEQVGVAGHVRSCWREIADVSGVVVPAAGVATGAGLPPVAVADRVDTVIDVRGLVCEFRTKSGLGARHTHQALRGVDLEVRAGEALSIVGESGSGKSTLLRVLAGLTTATRGTVLVHGSVQMVFQDSGSSLTPWMTVGELLRERLRPLGLRRAESASRTERVIAMLGLPPAVQSARPAELSGGQRQRVALARAVIVPPTILLCDEPTSALDASLAATVLNLIRDMRREMSMTVVFVTHDLAVARLMGDRIAVMADGQLVETGTADVIVTTPSHARTRALLDAVPRIDGPSGDRSGVEVPR
jgi:peptide/nickel transport system ATP-binding protein